jgi:hypothetical protein
MLHLLASIEIHFTIDRSLWLIKTPGEDKNTCMPINLPYLSNWDKKSGDLEELRKKIKSLSISLYPKGEV